MILNNYETIYILKAETNEEVNINLVNELKYLIKFNGGENIFVQHKGRRHLSFSINNKYDGFYVQINYDGNGNIVNILEKCMKFNDHIMRYLTIKQNVIQSQALQI